MMNLQSDKRQLRLAILAQVLYLGNLLALPGILLLVLIYLYFRFARGRSSDLATAHIRLATWMSLLGFVLLGSTVAVFWLAGLYTAGTWTAVILILLIMHTSLVMFGIVALARAMAGKPLLIK